LTNAEAHVDRLLREFYTRMNPQVQSDQVPQAWIDANREWAADHLNEAHEAGVNIGLCYACKKNRVPGSYSPYDLAAHGRYRSGR